MTPDTNTPAQPDAPALDSVLTAPEAARMMRVSLRTLERLCESGEGPRRISLTGRRVGYWRSDLFQWLQARTSPAKRGA